jgi:hypothetical protein
MALKDVIKAVSPVAMVAGDNPDMLRGMGVIGNVVANKLEDREERKRRDAEAGMVAAPAPGTPTMKNGGKVKSASARADGCAIRGKTRA